MKAIRLLSLIVLLCGISASVYAQDDGYGMTSEFCVQPRTEIVAHHDKRFLYCDIHSRRFAYRDQAIALRSDLEQRAQNYHSVAQARRLRYQRELKKHHDSLSE